MRGLPDAAGVALFLSTERPDQVRTAVPNGTTAANPPIGPLGQGLWTDAVLTSVAAALALARRRHRTSPED